MEFKVFPFFSLRVESVSESCCKTHKTIHLHRRQDNRSWVKITQLMKILSRGSRWNWIYWKKKIFHFFLLVPRRVRNFTFSSSRARGKEKNETLEEFEVKK